jgi:hypothetical protein
MIKIKRLEIDEKELREDYEDPYAYLVLDFTDPNGRKLSVDIRITVYEEGSIGVDVYDRIAQGDPPVASLDVPFDDLYTLEEAQEETHGVAGNG